MEVAPWEMGRQGGGCLCCMWVAWVSQHWPGERETWVHEPSTWLPGSPWPSALLCSRRSGSRCTAAPVILHRVTVWGYSRPAFAGAAGSTVAAREQGSLHCPAFPRVSALLPSDVHFSGILVIGGTFVGSLLPVNLRDMQRGCLTAPSC